MMPRRGETRLRSRGMCSGCIHCGTSIIQHSMGPENSVGLGDCWIMECLLPYLSMVTVPHIMVGLERKLDYRGVGLERFHCTVDHSYNKLLYNKFLDNITKQ